MSQEKRRETGSVLYQTVKGTNLDLVPSKLLNRVPRTAHTTIRQVSTWCKNHIVV